MSLAGSVEAFPLQEVVGLLASTAVRGVLQVHHDGGHAELHVDGGALVGWAPDGDDAAGLLATLLDADGARFEWEPREPELARVPVPLGELVGAAERRRAERAEMRSVAATARHRLRLVAARPDGGVHLDAGSWPVVCAIGGGADVAGVVAAVGGPELDVYRQVAALVGAGLVCVEPPEAPQPGGGRAEAVAADAGPTEVGTPAGAAAVGLPDFPAPAADVAAPVVPPLPVRRPTLAGPHAGPVAPVGDDHVDGLCDRGPWPSEQLRELVEQAHRETDAVLAEADGVARAVGLGLDRDPADPPASSPAPETAHVAASPAPETAPPAAAARTAATRPGLLRLFSSVRAS